MGMAVATIAATWFAFICFAGQRALWAEWPSLGPIGPIQLAIVLPPLCGVCAFVSWGAFRRWVLELDPVALIALQCMRSLGASHLVSWALGLIGGGFAWPVGVGNLLVAMVAVRATCAVAGRTPTARRWIVATSIFGLAEFAMTVALAMAGFFTRPFSLDPPVAAGGYARIVELPISIFPTFLIPFSSFCTSRRSRDRDSSICQLRPSDGGRARTTLSAVGSRTSFSHSTHSLGEACIARIDVGSGATVRPTAHRERRSGSSRRAIPIAIALHAQTTVRARAPGVRAGVRTRGRRCGRNGTSLPGRGTRTAC